MNEKNKNPRNQENNDEKYPGYPHYPAKEDIANPDNNNGITSMDENNPNGPQARNAGQDDADITREDINNLETTEQNLPTRDDNQLQHAGLDDTDDDGDPLNEASFENDLSGDDLDMPGAELDDDNEAIGEEDEENNYYSLGGDRHEDLENDRE